MEKKLLVPENDYDLPFYSWQCLSLQLKHRDVDLVIKSEKNMDKLLGFIVYNLRTVDGVKDSAIPFEKYLVKN